MKLNLIVIFIMLFTICKGQNLVPNPGFESYDSLPCDFIKNATQFRNMLHDWSVPNFTTPDLCSPLISASCKYGNPYSFNSGGIQTPRTGNIMIGMVCENEYYNEYIEAPLTTALVPGTAYEVKMYVSLAAKSDFANNNIGVYFSENFIADSNFLSSNYIPQILDTTTITDTLNWVLVSGCFTATKASKYMIIGNFASTCPHGTFFGRGWPMAYYFFDDISVTKIPACNNQQSNCRIGIPDTGNQNLKVYPNPFLNSLVIENGVNGALVEIRDILGRKMSSQNITSDKTVLNLGFLPNAPYILVYRLNDQQQIFKLIKL